MTKAVNKNVASLLSSTRSAGEELRKGIQNLRDHIEHLQGLKEEVLKRPVAYSVAEKRLDDWVAGQVMFARETATKPEAFVSSRPGWAPPRFPFVDSMIVALAAQIKQSMQEGLRELYEGLDWVDEADRQAEIAKLDQEILDAELAEESIIRTAEAAGFPVRRRAEADPRAVLATDEALP